MAPSCLRVFELQEQAKEGSETLKVLITQLPPRKPALCSFKELEVRAETSWYEQI